MEQVISNAGQQKLPQAHSLDLQQRGSDIPSLCTLQDGARVVLRAKTDGLLLRKLLTGLFSDGCFLMRIAHS